MILKHLDSIQGKTVLDLGCGDGALTSFICQKGAKVIGLDNQELGLKFAKEFLKSQGLEAELILADVYQIPLKDNSVDFVVASDIIEHVRKPDKLLREAQRVLKTGGTIIITTPYRLTEKPMDPFHYREFYPKELKKLVRPYFKDIEIKEFQPAFWFCLYNYEPRFPKCQYLLRYLINLYVLYFNRNPLLKDSSMNIRRKRDFYTHIFIKARK